MVNYCRVIGCHNRSDRERDLQFYRLPKIINKQGEQTRKLSEECRRLWLARLNQNFKGKNLDNVRICSAHFISGKRDSNPLSPDYVPSIFKHTSVQERQKRIKAIENFERRQMTKRKRREAESRITAVKDIEKTRSQGTQTGFMFVKLPGSNIDNPKTKPKIIYVYQSPYEDHNYSKKSSQSNCISSGEQMPFYYALKEEHDKMRMGSSAPVAVVSRELMMGLAAGQFLERIGEHLEYENKVKVRDSISNIKQDEAAVNKSKDATSSDHAVVYIDLAEHPEDWCKRRHSTSDSEIYSSSGWKEKHIKDNDCDEQCAAPSERSAVGLNYEDLDLIKQDPDIIKQDPDIYSWDGQDDGLILVKEEHDIDSIYSNQEH